MSLIPKKGTVYVVDDDEAVRDSLQWLLEGKDYRVRCFDSAETFLSRYDPREVACLIVDIRMGGMTGLELQDRWYVNARIWKRVHESRNEDDNPDIGNYVGRAELGLGWNVNQIHTLTFTARHSLGSTARGSVRLDWLHRLGTKWVGASSNLRLHTQLFSGYGDSLIDYNRKRTVFSVGVSLLDF